MTKLHRRPATGGYARGEDTRGRVIAAAIAVFGHAGYEHASTRDIAMRAGVNTPALQYYFDGKVGLYYACVDVLSAELARRMRPVLERADEDLAEGAGGPELIELVCSIQDAMIDAFFAGGDGPAIRRMIAWRDDVAETREARGLMRDRVNLPTIRTASRVVGAIIGRPPDDIQTGLRTYAILGQVMAFHLDENRIFDALGWRAPEEGGLPLLKSILRTQTTLLLEGLAGDPPARRAKRIRRTGGVRGP